jgi:Tetratricopeptide repeat.
MIVAVASLMLMLFNRTTELQTALDSTRQEQQRVEQVTEFLVDVFKLTDPLGQSVQFSQVKDVINEARIQLDSAFQDDLKTRRKLLMTLATIYLNMSDSGSAQKLLDRARDVPEPMSLTEQLNVLNTQVAIFIETGELQQAEHSVHEFRSNHALQSLSLKQQQQLDFLVAHLAYLNGHYQSATTQLERLQTQLARTPKQLQDLQAQVYQLMGSVAWKQGQLKQAQDYYSQAHRHFSSQYGDLDNRSLKSQSTLGVLVYTQGQYDVAVKHFEGVLTARQKQLGEQHKLTADAHNRLAAVYFELGQLNQADVHYSAALQTYEDLDLDHSLVYARVLNNRALLWRQQQKYSRAIEILNQSRQIQQQQLGVNHPDLASVENNLGLLSYDLGQIDEAIDWFKKAYQRQINHHPQPPVSAAYAMNNLAHMLLLKGQIATARTWANDSMALRLAHLDKAHLAIADNLMILARLALSDQRDDQASVYFKQALDIRQQHLDSRDWRVLETQLWQTAIDPSGLTAQQKNQSMAGLCQRFGPSHPTITPLLTLLADAEQSVMSCGNQ